MMVTDKIHAIKIPFKVPVSSELSIDRFAFAYLVMGSNIHLIDSGVAGAESTIWDYIKRQGRNPNDIATLILTHSHPDHIGAAKTIKDQTDCAVFAHKNEQTWIEDTKLQYKERPVPGFPALVAGPVKVDHPVEGGDLLELEKEIKLEIIHTPGHSKGSLSLLLEEEKSLLTGDALIFPGDLPIYEDISDCLSSIKTLRQIKNVENLFSSWEPPIHGTESIDKRMEESIAFLQRIHEMVSKIRETAKNMDIMELCQKVVSELGLPPFAANPLVAKAFASSLTAEQNQKIA